MSPYADLYAPKPIPTHSGPFDSVPVPVYSNPYADFSAPKPMPTFGTLQPSVFAVPTTYVLKKNYQESRALWTWAEQEPGVSDTANACPGCGAKITRAGSAPDTRMTIPGGFSLLFGIDVVLFGLILGPIQKIGFALPAALVNGPLFMFPGWISHKPREGVTDEAQELEAFHRKVARLNGPPP